MMPSMHPEDGPDVTEVHVPTHLAAAVDTAPAGITSGAEALKVSSHILQIPHNLSTLKHRMANMLICKRAREILAGGRLLWVGQCA